MQVFGEFFRQITTHNEPRPWQEQLASESTCKSKVIRIFNSLGKTKDVLAAWIYSLISSSGHGRPTRLICVFAKIQAPTRKTSVFLLNMLHFCANDK